MNSILSDILYINVSNNTTELIEKELSKKYNSIIRWAIIAIENDKLKISVTYETGV